MANTPNLNLQEPAYNSPNWDSPLNSNFTILDSVLGNTAGITVTGLTSPQTLSTAQTQNVGVDFSGILTGNFVFNISVGGSWIVKNSCSGNYTLSLAYGSNSIVVPVGGPYLVSTDTTSGTISFSAQIAIQTYAGNPNGNVAGNATAPVSFVWDSTDNLLWVCTTTGISTSAVWTPASSVLKLNTLSPTALSANVNDYSPTGYSSASILRIAQNTQGWSITGLAAGGDGRYLIIENISSYNLTLLDQNTGSAAANRFLIGFNYVIQPGQSAAFWYDVTSTAWSLVGQPYNAPFTPPGLRLSLTSNSPVITSDVTSATTIYYTPYINGYINLPNGSGSWYTAATGQISQALSDSTKSPSSTSASNAYDLFVWNDAGTIRCTRGYSWASGTGGSNTQRGTGAGSTELARDTVAGVYTNKWAITNGPAAGLGVYVGSFITNSSNGVDWVANPASANGGGNCRLQLWNMYNRIGCSATSRDNGPAYNNINTSWRPANNSTNNRVTYFSGLNEGSVWASFISNFYAVNGNFVQNGLSLDSTNTNLYIAGQEQMYNINGANSTGTVIYQNLPGIGSHYLQGVEQMTSNAGIGSGYNGIIHQLTFEALM